MDIASSSVVTPLVDEVEVLLSCLLICLGTGAGVFSDGTRALLLEISGTRVVALLPYTSRVKECTSTERSAASASEEPPGFVRGGNAVGGRGAEEHASLGQTESVYSRDSLAPETELPEYRTDRSSDTGAAL